LQISQSRDSFRANSRRESVKYASELVREYLKDIIPIQNTVDECLSELQFTYFTGELNLKSFTLSEINKIGGALREHFLYANQTIRPSKNKDGAFVKMIEEANMIEFFATPFIERVADEKVAFNSIGITFCKSIKDNYSHYVLARSGNENENNYFPNTIALYNIWSNRIKELKLKTIVKTTTNTLKEISKENNIIKLIGTE